MAPVIRALREAGSSLGVRTLTLATGQHTDMLDGALRTFGLTCDHNLNIMRASQSLDHITTSVLAGAGEYFDATRPDAVLVHGDTTTTFAAALAAFYRHIRVGHVEAGLRSHDMGLPFPEEMNRVLTDRLAEWYYAPTHEASETLEREGVPRDRLWLTGNTVIDALRFILEKKGESGTGRYENEALSALAPGAPFILVTAHRRESWGEAMRRIARAASRVCEQVPGLWAVVPMHKNPAVRETIREILGGRERVVLCDPLDYADFVRCMADCRLILSDSGGVQEEASALRKAVLILRDVTERPEAVERGSGLLVGTDEDKIVNTAVSLLTDGGAMDRLLAKCDPQAFGDGHAAQKIATALLERL